MLHNLCLYCCSSRNAKTIIWCIYIYTRAARTPTPTPTPSDYLVLLCSFFNYCMSFAPVLSTRHTIRNILNYCLRLLYIYLYICRVKLLFPTFYHRLSFAQILSPFFVLFNSPRLSHLTRFLSIVFDELTILFYRFISFFVGFKWSLALQCIYIFLRFVFKCIFMKVYVCNVHVFKNAGL